MQESLYDSYVQFKSWDEVHDDAYQDFVDIFNQAGLGKRKLKVLELGCGAGRFMDWARQAGPRH
jgi:cyclopropane fatty-acyl-phospholipid synthase-like methyltransferase